MNKEMLFLWYVLKIKIGGTQKAIDDIFKVHELLFKIKKNGKISSLVRVGAFLKSFMLFCLIRNVQRSIVFVLSIKNRERRDTEGNWWCVSDSQLKNMQNKFSG